MVLAVSDYQRGLGDQSFTDRAAAGRVQRDANDAVASWQRYAAELEARLAQATDGLAQATAESYAAQYQRNVFATQLDAVQAELRRKDPKNALADEVATTRARCQQVDAHLQSRGLQIDRSNPRVFKVLGRLR